MFRPFTSSERSPILDPTDDQRVFSSAVYSKVSFGVKVLAALMISLVIVPPVAGVVGVATLLKAPLPVGELPDERPQMVAVPSVAFAADGTELAVFRGYDETVEVDPAEIPQVLKDAVVAIEDRRFWEHSGVDLEGIARAARTNLEVGGFAQGGSTITQQYIKNVYLTREKTLERKVNEALLATELEKQLTKEEILFGYLETSFYGSGAYGIGAAAKIYFGKPVSDLDISEAATIAGIVQRPTDLSPYENIEAADRRRRLVLAAMLDQGYITEEEYSHHVVRRLWSIESPTGPDGPVTTLVPRPPKGASAYPYFADYVEQTLLRELGPDLVYRGGLRVETTIEPDLQIQAEAAVAARLKNTEYPVEMALTSIDPDTGHIVAMVGGRDYSFSQLNLAIGGSTGFQPGSSFKPFVLATALSKGMSPETVYPAPGFWVVPGCSGNQCTIRNYDGAARGDLTLRRAMELSVNTVFARLITDVGIADTATMAHNLGLSRVDPEAWHGASFALGTAETSTLEMASAYGTFANRGVRVEPTPISRVLDADGNVLIDRRVSTGDPILSEAVADNITNVLQGVVTSGTGARAAIGRPVAGKTGTAQAYRAAWFVGYTPQLVTAVWMGHADRLASLRGINGVGSVVGGSHPAIAFSQFMTAAHEDLPVEEFPEPVEIVPLVENATDMVAFRVQEQTLAGVRKYPSNLVPNCGGASCQRYEVPAPYVPAPNTPPTQRDPASSSTVKGRPSTSTGESVTTSTRPTETGSTPTTVPSSSTPTSETPSTPSSRSANQANTKTNPSSSTTVAGSNQP